MNKLIRIALSVAVVSMSFQQTVADACAISVNTQSGGVKPNTVVPPVMTITDPVKSPPENWTAGTSQTINFNPNGTAFCYFKVTISYKDVNGNIQEVYSSTFNNSSDGSGPTFVNLTVPPGGGSSGTSSPVTITITTSTCAGCTAQTGTVGVNINN